MKRKCNLTHDKESERESYMCAMEQFCLEYTVDLSLLFQKINHKQCTLLKNDNTNDIKEFSAQTLHNAAEHHRNFENALERYTHNKTTRTSSVIIIDSNDIYLKCLKTLRPREWIMDSIIDGYGSLLMAKLKEQADAHNTKVHIFNAFFWTTMNNNGNYDFNAVRRYNKGVDLLSCDILLIPIYLSSCLHWTLVSVYPRDRSIYYIDSMGNGCHDSVGKRTSMDILKYLFDWSHMNEKLKDFYLPQWKLYHSVFSPHNAPQQNGYDCGVYVMIYMDCLVNGYSISWINNDKIIADFRPYVAMCLINKRIL